MDLSSFLSTLKSVKIKARDNILKNLNPRQKEAVETLEGPLLILAGPGSGKTRVLTHRLACLIKNGISSQNIGGLTFTNKAADEMKQRVKKLLGGRVITPFIGTFHAFCLRILRKEIAYHVYSVENTKKSEIY